MSIKPSSKYYPPFEHLQGCDRSAVTLTFAEIEALMGCSLPASALKKKNWWSNRDRTYTQRIAISEPLRTSLSI